MKKILGANPRVRPESFGQTRGSAPTVIFFAMTMLISVVCFAASTEEWLGKASGTATQLAQGNTEGALYQAAPSYNTRFGGQTYLNAGIGGANLQQRIAPIDQLDSKYLGFDGSYNLRSGYGPGRRPTFSNDVQVSAQNQYLSNTTAFTPRFRRND